MQAIVHSRYGPPDALELKDIDTPVITDDAVLVRVHAAAVSGTSVAPPLWAPRGRWPVTQAA